MIPGGLAHQPGGGAMVLGQAARGFGGALFQALRGQPQAPPVTIQMPSGGMNVATAAAITSVAAQFSRETAALIQRVAPYVKGSFYAFMILICLVILEKVYNGPVGALLSSACKGLIIVMKAGAPVARAGVVRFFKAVDKVLRALFALPAQVRDAILERVVAIQNWADRQIRTVHDGLVVVKGYVRHMRNAVVSTMQRSLARVKAAGVRVRTAVRGARAKVGGFRARIQERAQAKENAALMERQQKIRMNLAAINQRVVANEERRIRNLINKVKRTSVPLTPKEKREYLALVRKAEKNAKKNANAAMRNASSANRNAAAVLASIGRRSH